MVACLLVEAGEHTRVHAVVLPLLCPTTLTANGSRRWVRLYVAWERHTRVLLRVAVAPVFCSAHGGACVACKRDLCACCYSGDTFFSARRLTECVFHVEVHALGLSCDTFF